MVAVVGTATSAAQRPAAVEDWLAEVTGDDRLVHARVLPGRAGTHGHLERPLPAPVAGALGVGGLWCHQAEAIDHLRRGTSVVVATGTGSGKSVCYQAVIAEAALQPLRPRTALLLHPTKALAQDQARRFEQLGLRGVVAGTYDGDASTEERAWVRNRANVVLTNPEMLHHGILPHHQRWSTFLSRLAYVVVDELHVLRGVFGSHVAQVLRRLRRLCAHYGARPTFAFTSATMGDPARLASTLCGLPVTAISEDGSARAERHFAIWQPRPLGDDGGRASASAEAATVAASLITAGNRTIVFSRGRKSAELVAADVRRRLPRELRDRVVAYRAGYLPEERREIEVALAEGRLDGVVATSALELGVDLPSLDACVLAGFPGTISSMWQQVGRVGRGRRASLAVLVPGADQLDQWLARHPDELFTRSPEPAVANASNPAMLLPHLECAAAERALRLDDEPFWPGDLDDGVRSLVLSDRLRVRRQGRRHEPVAAWAGSGWPSNLVGLRSSSRGEVRIIDEEGALVGTVDEARAADQVHPGAVYVHQGLTYDVRSLDLDERVAVVAPGDGQELTRTRTATSFRILEAARRRLVGRTEVTLGTVEVCSQVIGYRRIDARTGELLGSQRLDLPPGVLTTAALWCTFDGDVIDQAGIDDEAPGALHALEHAAIGLLPLFAICDRWDVGGVSTDRHADTGLPTVAIYDGYAGGSGIAELAFAAAGEHLAATLDAIAACPCHGGCPSCVQSPKCGNGNEPLDKAAAARLLRTVLGVTATPPASPGWPGA